MRCFLTQIICSAYYVKDRMIGQSEIKGVVTMQDNRNPSTGLGFDGRGTVCIDTKRVLDCCRDRDCYEDSRVYLTELGEEAIASATSIRAKNAKTICVNVGLEDVQFNCGFYRISIRYYIEIEFEACLGLGRSQTFNGLTVLEKDVVLYGGDGTVTSYSSEAGGGFCGICNPDAVSTNAPIAVVDTVEPVILGTRVLECECRQVCFNCCDLPECVQRRFDNRLVTEDRGARLVVSIGIFSVIRLVRPTLLLVQATDYSVPDKECSICDTNESPCDLFKTMAFPVARFQAQCQTTPPPENRRNGGCGCGK